MKIKQGFVLRDVAGQAVAIATGEASKGFHGMIKLNSTAADIWRWLAVGLTEDEIAAKLAQKYDVSVQKAKEDTHAQLEQMEQAGFLTK